MMDNVSNIDKNKRIAKNTMFLYIRLAFVMAVTLYTTRVILRVLGVEDYGIYNVVCGFVAMFGVIQSTISMGTSRFYNYKLGKEGEESINMVFNTSIRVQVILALILAVVVEGIGVWYINNKLTVAPDRLIAAKWIFQFSLFSLLVRLFSTPYGGVIFAFERMGYTAFVSILDAVLKLGIVFVIQYASIDKLILYGFLMSCISLVNLFCNVVYCKLSFKEVYLKRQMDKKLAKSIFSFSGWLLLDPIAYTLRGQGTNMVLNYFLGPVVNAAYGISNQVNSAMDSFTSSFSGAFKPQLVQSYAEGNFQRTKNLMLSMSKITWVLKVMLFVPFILNVDYILRLWLVDVPDYTVSFTFIILLTNLINTLNRPITQVILAIGNIRTYMIITSFIVILNIPISILFLYLGYDATFVLWSILILSVVNQGISVLILSKTFPLVSVKCYIKDVVLPCMIQLIVVVLPVYIVVLSINSGLLDLVLSCLASIAFTFLSSYFVVLSDSEKRILKSFAVSVKTKFVVGSKANN